MRIAIDVSQLVYEGRGVATYTKYLTKALLEQNDENHYTLFAGVLRQLPKIIKYARSEPWNRATWKVWPLPPKIAHRVFNQADYAIDPLLGAIDLLHASDWTHPRSRLPTVTTVHDLVFMKYPETQDPFIVKVMETRLERAKTYAAHIIADSESTKHDLIHAVGIDESRITTIYPAASEEFVPQSKDEVRRIKDKYAIPGRYIFSLSAQEPRKNLQKVLESFKAYKEQEKNDIMLVVAGQHGWGKQTMIQGEDIISLGFVDQQDLPAFYTGAEVCLYPSLYEGFGFPVLEAMACGTPVVTSNVSSLPEVAGQAGICVDPRDVFALRDALKKAIMRRSALENEVKKQAAKFTWGKTAKETLEVYESVYKANQR